MRNSTGNSFGDQASDVPGLIPATFSNLDLPTTGEEWAEQEWSLNYFPIGCGVTGCPTCSKGTDQHHRQRRTRLLAELFRFIEETGDGLLPYLLVEALQVHPKVQAYLDHIIPIDRLGTSDERNAVAQERVRFYTLLLEDLRALSLFIGHSSTPVENAHSTAVTSSESLHG